MRQDGSCTTDYHCAPTQSCHVGRCIIAEGTECTMAQTPECPTDDFCMNGMCEKGFAGTAQQMCNACADVDPDGCIFSIPMNCVEEEFVCTESGSNVECGEEHPEDPNRICGYAGQYWPNCD